MATLNLAKMTVSGTPGTGTVTLGAAVAPYQSFAAAQAQDGVTYSYVINEGVKFECGQGVYTVSGTTLSRVTTFDSSAGYGVKESFTSAAQVYSAMLRQDTVTVGKQSLWVPFGAMTGRTTNGPAATGQLETATNKVNVAYGAFDPSTDQYAQFQIRMPKAWNFGTVTFQPVWFHPATTVNFTTIWGLQGVAVRDNVGLDTAFGTAQTSTDTGGVTSNLYIGPESSAITIGNTPADMDYVIFQVYRNASAGGDNLAVNAYLAGITLNVWTDAENDN